MFHSWLLTSSIQFSATGRDAAATQYDYVYQKKNRFRFSYLMMLLCLTVVMTNNIVMTTVRMNKDIYSTTDYLRKPPLRNMLFITTHMSDRHIENLKSCWPLVLENSLLLNTTDVFVFLNCDESKLNEATELLQSTFYRQKLTIHTTNENTADKQRGAMAALTEAAEKKWLDNYDWVICLNPDVIVRDHSFLLNAMENDVDASALLINCRLWSSSISSPKILTGFFAIKPEVLPPDAFLNPTGRDAEDAFTNDIFDSILKNNTHRYIPDADSKNTACCAGALKHMKDTPITHFYLPASKICPVPISDHPGASFFNRLNWQGLPFNAKDAAKTLGFNQQIWDEEKVWPMVFGKHWNDTTEGERDALQTLGYFEKGWEAKGNIIRDDENSNEENKGKETTDEVNSQEVSWQNLWFGENTRKEDEPHEEPNEVDIIVTYCHAGDFESSIDHFENIFPEQIESVHLQIMSKCNQENVLDEHLKERLIGLPRWQFSIHPLENKGGCDLSVAHYIVDFLRQHPNPDNASNRVAIFLKDGPRTPKNFHVPGSHYRSLEEMFSIASSGRFVCGSKIHSQISAYHDIKALSTFMMNTYKRYNSEKTSSGENFTRGYKNLGDFVEKSMTWSWPNETFVEVCYGGTFAFHVSNLYNNDFLLKDLSRVIDILEAGRDLSIVEHFMERLWAALISKPLNKAEKIAMLKPPKSISKNIVTPGQLFLDLDRFHWQGLPSHAKDAAKTVGFNQQIWDEGKVWPEVFRKHWKDMTEDERDALTTLGYFEEGDLIER